MGNGNEKIIIKSLLMVFSLGDHEIKSCEYWLIEFVRRPQSLNLLLFSHNLGWCNGSLMLHMNKIHFGIFMFQGQESQDVYSFCITWLMALQF